MDGLKFLLGALVVLMALGGVAMAQNTQVNANVDSFISLAVPGPISGWNLAQGPNTLNVPAGLAVTTNAPWTISAQTALNVPDPSNDYYGHFWSQTAYSAGLGAFLPAGPGFLTDPLHLNAGSDVTLSDSAAILKTGASLGTTPVPFAMNQNVVPADPAENDYRIVIEFTASN
jgi:hypothetical protein